MMKKFSISIALVLLTVFSVGTIAQGQTPAPSPSPAASALDLGITPNLALGDVTALDAASKRITIKTKVGEITALLDEKTVYKRVAPGETTLKNAEVITLGDIGIGDRVMALGKVAEDRKSVPARQIVVMSKAAIAQKHERDREQWRLRGIVGRITAINPETKEITALTRSREGERPIVIAATDKVLYRRYAPDSIKFDDARPSSFAELKVGDELRALGEKSADGTRFTPEEIVSGSFRMVGGPVTAVNTATNEIKITNIQNGQPLTVVVGKDSMLRRLPPEMVEMIARRRAMGDGTAGAPGAGGAPGAQPGMGGPRQGGGGPGGMSGGGGMGGGGMRMRGDFLEMFEQMPAITIADLKPGEVIVVSSTTGADPSRVTAIRLATNLEPLLRAQPAQGQPGRPAPSLALPGLDSGIGLP